MASTQPVGSVAANHVKVLLLSYGIGRGLRVVTFEEIAQALGHLGKQAIRRGLDQLAEEDLVTRFAGRYCFNKSVPPDLLHQIEYLVTASGTIRQHGYEPVPDENQA